MPKEAIRIDQVNQTVWFPAVTVDDGLVVELFDKTADEKRQDLYDKVLRTGSYAYLEDRIGTFLGTTATTIGAEFEHLKLLFDRHQQSMVTAENIESLFAANQVLEEIDLLSIDIDGNDYWVWQAIERYRPRVVVVEYNAIWPPDATWVQAYDATRPWDGTTHHGASIGALTVLAEKKGYRLVCDVDFAGVAPIAGAITPVPGGVGPMTITMLLRNTITACKQIHGIG